MSNKAQQFTDLQRKSMDAGMKLAQMSIENSQRIVALQVDTARKLFQDSLENAKALASAKTPQEIVGMQARFAQETAKRMMETAQQIAELGNASGSGVGQMLTEQLTNSGKEMMASFQSLFSAMPGQDHGALDAMKQAMNTANAAFEQIVKTSTAFAGEAAGGMASKKK